MNDINQSLKFDEIKNEFATEMRVISINDDLNVLFSLLSSEYLIN